MSGYESDEAVATLVFYISGADKEVRQRVNERLRLDYSPPIEISNVRLQENAEWFVASQTILLAEFSNMVRYAPMLERLFSTSLPATLVPGYVTPQQFVIGSPSSDPRALPIGSNAWARPACYCLADGTRVDCDADFCDATGAAELFDLLRHTAQV